VKPRGNSWTLGAFLAAELDDLGLDPYTFRVWLHLCRRANNEVRAFPSIPDMADVCKMSARSVQRALQVLDQAGFITREAQYRKDGSRTVDLLTLHGPFTVRTGDSQSPGGAAVSPPGDSGAAHEGIPLEGIPSKNSLSTPLIPFADPPEWRESASAEQLTRLELARYNGLKSDPSAHPHVRAIRAAGADVWREFVKLGVLGKASDVTLTSWAQAMSADLEKHGREKVLAAIHAVQATPPEKRAYVWNWYRDELDGTKPARKVAQDQPSDRSRYDVKPLDESEHDSIRQRILKLAGEEAA
jgi:hypothetical protein